MSPDKALPPPPDWAEDDELMQMLRYLDELREGGSVNMFGAGPVLSAAFGLKRSEASEVLLYWMATFGARHEED